MTQEEKAKAYDEALKQAEVLHKLADETKHTNTKMALEKLFPQLVESKDERIRKRLIDCLKVSLKGAEEQDAAGCSRQKDIEAYKWGIAYLEKQKELPFVKDVMLGYPGLYFYDGERMRFQGNPAMGKKQKEQKPEEWEDEYREEDLQTRFAFYTYKDEPDILYLSNLFVEELSRGAGLGTRILKAAEKVAETIGATSICVKVKQDSPANKWYRKNGYGYKTFEGEYDWLEKTLEYLKPNKPAEWSEEDARKLRDSIRIIEDSDLVKSITEYYKQFLESLPERFNPTPKQEWSEEDEAMYNSIICEVVKEGMNLTEEQANWLKYLRPQPKQKDRYQEGFQDGVYEGRRKALEEYNKSVAYRCGDFNHKLSCYEGGPCTNPFFDCINCPRMGNNAVKTYTSPNITEYQSWNPSEEEKKKQFADGFRDARHTLATIFMKYLDENRPDGKMCLANEECIELERAFEIGDVEKIIRYFKKYQCDWKSSKEQMDTLKFVIGNHIFGHREHRGILESLYNDLKKLM